MCASAGLQCAGSCCQRPLLQLFEGTFLSWFGEKTATVAATTTTVVWGVAPAIARLPGRPRWSRYSRRNFPDNRGGRGGYGSRPFPNQDRPPHSPRRWHSPIIEDRDAKPCLWRPCSGGCALRLCEHGIACTMDVELDRLKAFKSRFFAEHVHRSMAVRGHQAPAGMHVSSLIGRALRGKRR